MIFFNLPSDFKEKSSKKSLFMNSKVFKKNFCGPGRRNPVRGRGLDIIWFLHIFGNKIY